jgi:hypothetical protein
MKKAKRKARRQEQTVVRITADTQAFPDAMRRGRETFEELSRCRHPGARPFGGRGGPTRIDLLGDPRGWIETPQGDLVRMAHVKVIPASGLVCTRCGDSVRIKAEVMELPSWQEEVGVRAIVNRFAGGSVWKKIEFVSERRAS